MPGPEIHILFGATGSGKTRWIYEAHGVDDVYRALKTTTHFMRRTYKGEPVVLIRYMTKRQMSIKRFIALLRRVVELNNPAPRQHCVSICGAKYLPHDHNHRNCCGQRYNSSPRIIYIESLQPPSMWWPGADSLQRSVLESMITNVIQFNWTVTRNGFRMNVLIGINVIFALSTSIWT